MKNTAKYSKQDLLNFLKNTGKCDKIKLRYESPNALANDITLNDVNVLSFVDGRLVVSSSYPPGNFVIDEKDESISLIIIYQEGVVRYYSKADINFEEL